MSSCFSNSAFFSYLFFGGVLCCCFFGGGIVFCFCLFWNWESNPGLCEFEANALPLSYIPAPNSAFLSGGHSYISKDFLSWR